MLTLSMNIQGHTADDLQNAVTEVTRLIGEGFTSGASRNDTGRFSFIVAGEEVPPVDD